MAYKKTLKARKDKAVADPFSESGMITSAVYDVALEIKRLTANNIAAFQEANEEVVQNGADQPAVVEEVRRSVTGLMDRLHIDETLTINEGMSILLNLLLSIPRLFAIAGRNSLVYIWPYVKCIMKIFINLLLFFLTASPLTQIIVILFFTLAYISSSSFRWLINFFLSCSTYMFRNFPYNLGIQTELNRLYDIFLSGLTTMGINFLAGIVTPVVEKVIVDAAPEIANALVDVAAPAATDLVVRATTTGFGVAMERVLNDPGVRAALITGFVGAFSGQMEPVLLQLENLGSSAVRIESRLQQLTDEQRAARDDLQNTLQQIMEQNGNLRLEQIRGNDEITAELRQISDSLGLQIEDIQDILIQQNGETIANRLGGLFRQFDINPQILPAVALGARRIQQLLIPQQQGRIEEIDGGKRKTKKNGRKSKKTKKSKKSKKSKKARKSKKSKK